MGTPIQSRKTQVKEDGIMCFCSRRGLQSTLPSPTPSLLPSPSSNPPLPSLSSSSSSSSSSTSSSNAREHTLCLSWRQMRHVVSVPRLLSPSFMGTVLWVFLCFGCLLSAVQSASNASAIDPSFSSLRLETDRLFNEASGDEKTTLPTSSRIVSLLSSSNTAENVTEISSISLQRIASVSTKVPRQELSTPLLNTNLSSSFSFVSIDSIIQATSPRPSSSLNTQNPSERDQVLQSSIQHKTEQLLATSPIPKTSYGSHSNSIFVSNSDESDLVSKMPNLISIASVETSSVRQTIVFEESSTVPNSNDVLLSKAETPMLEESQSDPPPSTMQIPMDNFSESFSTDDSLRFSDSIGISRPMGEETPSSQLLRSDSGRPQVLPSHTSFVHSDHSEDQVQNRITSMPILPSFSRSKSFIKSEFSHSQSLFSNVHASSVFLFDNSSTSDTLSMLHSSRGDGSNLNRSSSQSDISDPAPTTASIFLRSDSSVAHLDTSIQTPSNDLLRFSSPVNMDMAFDTEFASLASTSADSGSQSIKPNPQESQGGSFYHTASSMQSNSQISQWVEASQSLTKVESAYVSNSVNQLPSESKASITLHPSLDTMFTASHGPPLESQHSNQQSNNNSLLMSSTPVPSPESDSHKTEFIGPSVFLGSVEGSSTLLLQTAGDEPTLSKGDNKTASIDNPLQEINSQQAMASKGSNTNLASDVYSDLTSSIPMSEYDDASPIPSNARGDNSNTFSFNLQDPSPSMPPPTTTFTESKSLPDSSLVYPTITSVTDHGFENNRTLSVHGSMNSDINVISNAQSVLSSNTAASSNNTIDNPGIRTSTPSQSVDELLTPFFTSTLSLSTSFTSLPDNNNSQYKSVLFSNFESASQFPILTSTLNSTNSTMLHSESEMSLSSFFTSTPSSSESTRQVESNDYMTQTSLSEMYNSSAALNPNPISSLSIEIANSDILQNSPVIRMHSTHSIQIHTSSLSKSEQYSSNMTATDVINKTITQSLDETVLSETPMGSSTDTNTYSLTNNETEQFLSISSVISSLDSSVEVLSRSTWSMHMTATPSQLSSFSNSELALNQSTTDFVEDLNSNSSLLTHSDTKPGISDSAFLFTTSIDVSRPDSTPIISPNRTMSEVETTLGNAEMTTTNPNDAIINSTADLFSSFSTVSDVHGSFSSTPAITSGSFTTVDLNSTLSRTSKQVVNETNVSSYMTSFHHVTSNNQSLVLELSMEPMYSSDFENNISFEYPNSADSILPNMSSITSLFETTLDGSPLPFTSQLINPSISLNLKSDIEYTAVENATEPVEGLQSIEPSVYSTHQLNTSDALSTSANIDTGNSSELLDATYSTISMNLSSSPSQSISRPENMTSEFLPTPFIEASSYIESKTNDFISSDIFPSVPSTDAGISTSMSINKDSSIPQQFFNSSSDYSLGSSSHLLNVSSMFDALPTTIMTDYQNVTTDILEASSGHLDFNSSTVVLIHTSLQELDSISMQTSSSQLNSSIYGFDTIHVEISSTSDAMHTQQSFRSSLDNSSSHGLDSIDIEITPTSNVEDMDLTLSPINDNSSEIIEPTRPQFNFSSALIDVIETSRVNETITLPSVFDQSSIPDNSSSSGVDLFPSSEEPGNSSHVAIDPSLLDTSSKGDVFPYSNATIDTMPTTPFPGGTINQTNSLDVSPGVSGVSLNDSMSTHVLNSSQENSIEDVSVFPTITQISDNSSLATSPLENAINVTTSGAGTLSYVTATSSRAPNSSEILMSMTSEAGQLSTKEFDNETDVIDTGSPSDFILSTDTLNGSFTVMHTATTNLTTDTDSSVAASAINMETTLFLQSSSTSNTTITPNTTTEHSMESTLSPTPTTPQTTNTSSQTLESSISLYSTINASTIENTVNISAPIEFPNSTSQPNTSTSVAYNTTTHQSLSFSTDLASDDTESTDFTTPVEMSSSLPASANVSEVPNVSPSTVNQTLPFHSDNDMNLTSSIDTSTDITPTQSQTTIFQSPSITTQSSINLNGSSESITISSSTTALRNITEGTPGTTMLSSLPIIPSPILNASSSSLSSPNASMSTPFQDLNSTILSDSILPSPSDIIYSHQSMSLSESSPININTTISFSSLTDTSNTSATQTSIDTTLNHASSSFSNISFTLIPTTVLETPLPSNTSDLSSTAQERQNSSVLPINLFSSTTTTTTTTPTPNIPQTISSPYIETNSSSIDTSSNHNTTDQTGLSTPHLLSATTDIAPNSSITDSPSSINATSTPLIISSTQIPQTLSAISSLAPSELFTNTTSPTILQQNSSLITPSDSMDLSIIASSLLSQSPIASIFNSQSENISLPSSLSPTPQFLSYSLGISDKFSDTTEINTPLTNSNMTSDTYYTPSPPFPGDSSSIKQTSFASTPTLATYISQSSSSTLESGEPSPVASLVSSSATTTMSSESSILPPSSPPPQSSSSSSSSSTSSSSPPSPSSSPPQPTSSSIPTGSTLPTIDNSGHLTSYWVSVGLLVRTSVDVETPQFKSQVEQGLANAYALGRQRQEEIDNGTFESLGKKKKRKRRSVTAAGDPNVKVEVTRIERKAGTTSVDVSHVLQQDGALVPAEDAAKQMALLNDMELAIQLNQVVDKGPKPYITPASDSDDDDNTVLIAGSVSGAVAALIVIVIIVLCCCCGGNRCCVKSSSGEFTISDLSEKSHVVPTTAAENPSYYVDDESQGNATMSITSKKGKYTLADEVEMDDAEKRVGRPMPARRPPQGKKSSVENQRHVSSDENADHRGSPKKKRGKKKKEMDTDEAMEMRSIYESQIASLQESPTHTPLATSPVDLVITGAPTVEMEEDLLENAEEERRKNKQRLREKRRKEKEHESPVKKPQDDVDIVYESAQKEIDKVLGPRKDGEKPRKKSKDKKKKKEKSDDSDENSQQGEGPPSDTLEDARVKIHRLLDDAFSLISQSRSSIGNKVHPTSQQSSLDKGSPRSQLSHRSHSSIEHADQDAGDTAVEEKKHTPLYVERSHGAYDRSGLISWSPYRASDDTALISLPNTQTNINSVAPQGEPIKGTTVFSESLPNSLQPHYYTTLPGEPIVLRTKDLDSNNQPYPPAHRHHGAGESISIKSENKPTAIVDPEVKSHRGHQDDLYTPYYGMSSYHELPPSTVVPNSPNESSNENYHNGKNSSRNNQDYYSSSDYSNNMNSINNDSKLGDSFKMHNAPGRGRESNGKDFVDVIKHSVEPGASPRPLIHSLREELLNLSRKKGLSSPDSYTVGERGDNGMEKVSALDGKPRSGVTSLGQDMYYRNSRNRHMKTDL